MKSIDNNSAQTPQSSIKQNTQKKQWMKPEIYILDTVIDAKVSIVSNEAQALSHGGYVSRYVVS